MASGSKGKRSNAKFDLTKLINKVRDSNDSWETIQTWHLQEGDDRSQGIVAGALLEQALEIALDSHFEIDHEQTRSLFIDQGGGSISSFATKIKLAYALGMVEQIIRSELTSIKDIRNVFAHTREAVSFESPEIIAACELLRIPQIVRFDGGLIGPPPVTPKDKFAASVRMIYLYFGGDLGNRLTGKKPLKYADSDFYCALFLKQLTRFQRRKALAAALLKGKDPFEPSPKR
jgi:hypothetical protein